jgi:hypothetical protein
MTLNFVDPYTGEDGETCSVSFAAQTQMAGTTGSPQTEADFNKSKLLGEWGVIKAKLTQGKIAIGTKVLSFENVQTGARGYAVSAGNTLKQVLFTAGGKKLDPIKMDPNNGDTIIKSPFFKASIPQAVDPGPSSSAVAAPTPVAPVNAGSTSVGSMSHEDVSALFVKVKDDLAKEQGLNIKGANPALDQEVYAAIGKLIGYTPEEVKAKVDAYKAAGNKLSALKKKVLSGTKKVPTVIASDPKPVNKPPVPANPIPQVPLTKPDPANPTAPVSKKDAIAKLEAMPKSENGKYLKDGTGGVGLKYVSAYEVGLNKAVDKWAKEQGDAPSALKTVADKYGYEQVIDTATTDLYTSQEWLYHAVVKKYINNPGDGAVLAVRYQGKLYIVDGNHRAASAKLTNSSFKALVLDIDKHATTDNFTPDPKPNGVPTVATNSTAKQVKEEVQAVVAEDPTKVYSDEDVASAYIIAKDAIVAGSNGKWTLYTKSEELDLDIAIAVGLKTGLNPLQQKQAIANYLATGKKLSALKKQLIKQGAMKAQADTLKKGNAAKTQAEKEAEVNAAADAGYTPTPAPSAGTPPTDTGKPAPKRVREEAQDRGDISGISDAEKKKIFDEFKATGSKSWLSSGSGQNYEGFVAAKAATGDKYTLLQLIRVVDEQGAKKAGVENGKLFEKQVATWLTTPEGTKYIKDKEVELAKAAQLAKEKAEADKKAKELEDNQPPLPADSTRFQVLPAEEALALQQRMQEAKPWTSTETTALRYYTSNAGYTAMNGANRKGSGSTSTVRSIKAAQSGMRPSDTEFLLHRGCDLRQVGLQGNPAGIWGLTGKLLKDDGFMSTSYGGRAAFGGELLIEFQCPKGTLMTNLKSISHYSSENEILLAAGTQYRVLRVERRGANSWKIIVRVEGNDFTPAKVQ